MQYLFKYLYLLIIQVKDMDCIYKALFWSFEQLKHCNGNFHDSTLQQVCIHPFTHKFIN